MNGMRRHPPVSLSCTYPVFVCFPRDFETHSGGVGSRAKAEPHPFFPPPHSIAWNRLATRNLIIFIYTSFLTKSRFFFRWWKWYKCSSATKLIECSVVISVQKVSSSSSTPPISLFLFQVTAALSFPFLFWGDHANMCYENIPRLVQLLSRGRRKRGRETSRRETYLSRILFSLLIFGVYGCVCVWKRNYHYV